MEALTSPRSRDTVLLGTLFLLAASAVAEAGWYAPAGWQYRRKLTLNGGLIQGTQTDFPVLVGLNDPDSHLKANAQADGDDILFTAADGTTKLAHEIERYDAATGALVAWVKVPALTNGTNTVVYMYYGNPGAANQQNATAVWDPGYRGVWHLGESGAAPASYRDSTANGNNGTTTSHPGAATGQVGAARQFNGIANYISAANSASLQLTTALTLQGWVRLNSFDTTYAEVYPILRKGTTNNNDYQLGARSWSPATAAGHAFLAVAEDDEFTLTGTGAIASTLNWYHVVGTWDGTTRRLFVNGVQVASGAKSGPIVPDARALFIGGRNDFQDMTDGILDEVRISSADRSATWIQTEYNNQARGWGRASSS